MGVKDVIPKRERIATRLFFSLMAVVYVALFPYFRFLNNPNEHTRTYLTMSLVEDGSFAITTQIRRFGFTGDLASRPDERGQSAYYGVKAPATSYLGVPVYAAYRAFAWRQGWLRIEDVEDPDARARYLEEVTHVLRVFCVQIPCFVFLVFFERFLRTRSRDLSLRLAAVAAVGLGTNFFAYALSFTSHALFACAAFTSFALTTLERERAVHARRTSRAFLAGFFAALCTLLEYHAAGVSLMLGVYAVVTFRRPRGVIACGVAAAINAAGMLFYQWKSFGDPLTPGHKLQINQAFAAHHASGVNGVSTPDMKALAALTFDPGFGLFPSSPYLFLGLCIVPFGIVFLPASVRARARERSVHLVGLLTMLGLCVLVSGVHNWRGGWSVGPRYLGAAPPFFAFFALCAAETFAGTSAVRRAIARAVSLGFATASVVLLGSVALLVDTLPEEISRPFDQFAIPMLRAGFVPHHVLELVGVTSGTPVYLVGVLCLVCVAIAWVSALRLEHRAGLLVVPLAAAMTALALVPARSRPEDLDVGRVQSAVGLYARNWNPKDRDAISRMRARLRRDDHCGFHALADMELSVGLVPESMASRAQAGVPRAACPALGPLQQP